MVGYYLLALSEVFLNLVSFPIIIHAFIYLVRHLFNFSFWLVFSPFKHLFHSLPNICFIFETQIPFGLIVVRVSIFNFMSLFYVFYFNQITKTSSRYLF